MRLFLLYCLILFSFTSSAFAEKRIALVVGNSDYQQGYLKNPSNDASDISSTLQELGFSVDLVKDASRKTFHKAVQRFRNKLGADTEVAFFYYAGHGAQFEGDSYLLPLQSDINSAADLPIEALKAKDILTQMRSSNSEVNVMVLDACRDLPYRQLNRSASRGLSRIKTSDSTLVAYSTSPGQVAKDGKGRNSPYTEELLKHLSEKNLTLTQLFNNIGRAVKQNTNGKQIPWFNSSPMPDIYLAGSEENIWELQGKLKQKGYYHGEINGKLTEETKIAIREHRKDKIRNHPLLGFLLPMLEAVAKEVDDNAN